MHFFVTFIGSYLIFWPMHYMGMGGVPRRYYSFDAFDTFAHFTEMNKFITVVVIITYTAQFLFIINFFYSMYKGRMLKKKNIWNSTTLEWTAPIEHIHGNWEGEIPTVYRGAYEYGKDGRDFIPQTEADEEVVEEPKEIEVE